MTAGFRFSGEQRSFDLVVQKGLERGLAVDHAGVPSSPSGLDRSFETLNSVSSASAAHLKGGRMER
jgi:hypothetical protein